MGTANQSTASDERILAALSHFMGVFVALIIWATQKDRSRFVRFQAIQAMAFDGIIMLAATLMSGCAMIVMFLGMFGTMFAAVNSAMSNGSLDPFFMFPVMLPFTIFACLLPFSFAVLIARVVAAASVLSGRDFRYPWLGQRVEGFLHD